jgi:uncharacterized OB-fold protein
MGYNKPLPNIDTLTKPFWDAAKAGRLVVQHCLACGDVHFPPGPVCPKCLSTEQDWQTTSGHGTLEGWVDFHRAYWDGFKDSLPYRCCLVKLDEGPVLVSNLVGDGDPKFGAKVKVVFDTVTDEITLPKFALER